MGFIVDRRVRSIERFLAAPMGSSCLALGKAAAQRARHQRGGESVDADHRWHTPSQCDVDRPSARIRSSVPKRLLRLGELRTTSAARKEPSKRTSLIGRQIEARGQFENGDSRPQRGGAVRRQAGAAEPIPHEWLVDKPCQRTGVKQADPAFPVLTNAQRFVEASDREQCLTPHNRLSEETAFEDLEVLCGDRERCVFAEPRHDLATYFEVGVCQQDVEIGTFDRELRDRRQPLWLVDVVGVQDRDEVSARPPNAHVSRCGCAAVFLPDIGDPVLEAREHFLRTVRRAVVDHYQLMRSGGLTES